MEKKVANFGGMWQGREDVAGEGEDVAGEGEGRGLQDHHVQQKSNISGIQTPMGLYLCG